MIKKGLFILFAFTLVQLYAQNSHLPLSHTANLIYEQEINASKIHSSFQPLIKSTVKQHINTDSLMLLKFSQKGHKWYKRKFFSEHLIVIKGEDYNVTTSPIIHFLVGKESATEAKTLAIQGDLLLKEI